MNTSTAIDHENMHKKLGWHTLGQAFDCACGQKHALPIQACHIGPGAARHLAAFARELGWSRCLVVSDENTRASDGDTLVRALRDAGIRPAEKQFADAPLEATDGAAKVVGEAGAEEDGYVALGGGTLSDLAKSAGDAQGKPVLLYPTAASMNGYTSAIVALKVNGLKRTLPCAPALGIFADPALAAAAPGRMAAAGLADFLSKASSAADWQAAHLLRGAYYCARPREFCEGIQDALLNAAPAVGKGESEAIEILLKALMLSGFGMVVAGSSAPASGGEHLISHYLDMKHALDGTPNDLHGIQVGVATVHTLTLWRRILESDPASIDPAVLAANQPAPALVKEAIMEDWGPRVGGEVLLQWQQKSLDPKSVEAELALFVQRLPEIRERLSEDLLPSETVARAIQEAGGPPTPDGMMASKAEYRKALRNARFLRNRFTVLDLEAELGID